jgi:hypothetical protein
MEGTCAYLSALGTSKKHAATRRSFLDDAVAHLATPRVGVLRNACIVGLSSFFFSQSVRVVLATGSGS